MAMWVMAVVGAAPCQCFSPGGNQTNITRVDFLDWSSFALDPAAACGDDESLTEGMRMPGRPGTRLKGYAGTSNKCRIGCLK